MSRVLDVFLHEVLAGKLIQDDSGRLSFAYDKDYLSLALPIVSVSMPLSDIPYGEKITRPYFSGILPDDIVRHRLARFLGVSEKNPFSLLEAIGGECAGALTLLPEGRELPEPSPKDIEVLDDQRLNEILGILKQRPLMVGMDNIRLSLAGAQDKIAVTLKGDKVCLVHGTTPTTHILKPAITDIENSVHNEVFCMRLASRVKIETPRAFIRWIGSTPYFLVERYDREITSEATVRRLHQEDFCQAMSIMPDLKYEKEGGPSIKSSLNLIDLFSESPAADKLSFIRRVIYNYIIGNADAHGKNFSFLYTSKVPRLSPAYDLMSTKVYPNLAKAMAMRIGNKYDPDKVFLRHWHSIVPDTKAAQNNLKKQILSMVSDISNHAQTLIKEFESQGVATPLFDEILRIVKARSEHLKGAFD